MPVADDPTRPGAQRRVHIRERHRYGIVLALIVLSVTMMMALPDGNAGRLVSVALQATTLVVACWTTRVSRLTLAIAAAGAVLGIAGSVLALAIEGSSATRAVVAPVSILLSVVAPLVIVSGVIDGIREHGRVTMAAMFGALSIYLLIALLFANVYAALAIFDGAALFVDHGDGGSQDRLYFSFVTITTTGYGDLAPATHLGRAFAMLEAVIGQVYLVTIVALVVTHLAMRLRPRRRA